MQTRLKMSREGLELLKEFEGLRLAAAQLPDGRWTIGHGHTQYAREGATITAADAEALLIYDLIPVTTAVNDGVTRQISQHQFDALSCFAFNVGIEAFQQSEVLQRVNQERMTEAALAMAIWRAGAFNGRRVVLDALVRRRSAEEALMLGGEGRPAPSDLVRPQIDPTAQASLPSSRPAEVNIQFDGRSVEVELIEDVDGNETDATAAVSAVEDEGHTAELDQGIDARVAEVEQEATAPEAAAAPEFTDPVAGGPEPIAYAGLTSTPAAPLANASVSTRVYSSYTPEPFSPLAAAQPEPELLETTGLMEAPGLDASIEEPPLVLVLTPPPEVAREPSIVIESDRSGTTGVGVGDEQTALFDDAAAVPPPPTDDAVIYYEPMADTVDQSARWSDTGAYVATGIVGLAAFGFGIAGFQLAGQDPVPTGLFDEKTAISWVLVAIGVVCVWIAAYNLFKRLGSSQGE